MKPSVRQRLTGLFVVLLSLDTSNQLSHRVQFQSTGPYDHRTSTSTSTSTPTQHWRQGTLAHGQILFKHQTTSYRSTPDSMVSQTNHVLLTANTVTHDTDTFNNLKEVSKTTDGKNITDLVSNLGAVTTANPSQNSILHSLLRALAPRQNDQNDQVTASSPRDAKNTTDLVSNLGAVENNKTADSSPNSMLHYLLRAAASRQNDQNAQVTASSLRPDSSTMATTDDGSFPDITSWPAITPDTGQSLPSYFPGMKSIIFKIRSMAQTLHEHTYELDYFSLLHGGSSQNTIYDNNYDESIKPLDTKQENSTVSYTTMPKTETEKQKQRIFTASSFNMTTEFLTDCFAEKSLAIFLQPESIGIYFSSEQCDEILFAKDLHCEVELRVPENKVIAIELKETSALEEKLLSFSFRHQFGSKHEHIEIMSSHYIHFSNTTIRAYSDPGSTVYFLLERANSYRSTIPVQLWLSLRQIDKDEVPGLEVVFTNPTTGFIQPPSYGDHQTHLFNRMETWTKVAIPQDFSMMISLHDKRFLGSAIALSLNFALYINGKSHSNLVGRVSNLEGGQPTALRGRTLYVLFQLSTMNFIPIRGLRLLFSFHKKSTPLRRLPGGKWICSVPYWSEYSHHFPCNLVENCADGRDEAECPYTSPSCKRGYFRVGEKCYLLIQDNDLVRWYHADVDCQRRRGQLATFQTQQERDGLIDLLQTYRQLADIVIGITTTPEMILPIYKWTLQYGDGTIAHYAPLEHALLRKPKCFILSLRYKTTVAFSLERCEEEYFEYACEFPLADTSTAKPEEGVVSVITNSQPITSEQNAALPSPFVTCPHQHATHTFLACDLQSACWLDRLELCTAPLTPLPPSFECTNGVQRISYTLVCDFRHDCGDSSDETFCQHVPCVLSEFQCQNGQCVDQANFCDGVADCLDGSDETRCSLQFALFKRTFFSGPALVKFNGDGTTSVDPLNSTYLNSSTGCPDNHFRCPGNGYCLPVYARCNGVYDCPGREDEMECESYTCPGFYRCRGSKICLSREQVCDSIYHCPQYDDELLCGLLCPDQCICYGLSWFCSSPLPTNSSKRLRFLDATGSGLDLAGVENSTLLIHLSLAGCRITRLKSVFMPNLHSFDLRDNLLVTISKEDIAGFSNLQHLSLKDNPLLNVFTEQERSEQYIFPYLFSLDLSHVKMVQFRMDTLFIFPNLRSLNLTACGIERLFVEDNSESLKHLRYLDLRGSPITHFSPDVLQGLSSLHSIFSDNYKLCCPALLPSRLNPVNCKAPSDEISSCQNLLRSDIYRGFLALFAGLSLLGNLLTFFTRVFQSKVKNGFDMLTITLCVSDFLMGVYLAVIGVADRLYIGTYLWEDVNWRQSAVCKAAGFLSMLSNEMSAITVCLITLDRFLVLQFPFRKLHFSRKGAMLVSGLVLAVGLILASVPLLPVTSLWNFYSQTGICIPLPITRNNFAGHDYSFAILIVFNFVLFLFIAMGQFFIYWSVKTNQMKSGKSGQGSNKDLKLAQRLIAIALSDFLCWFPVGLMGILASNGVPVSGEVNVAFAIFVMPLNSALNPYLYTLNKVLEKRQAKKEERMKQFLLKQMRAIDNADFICETDS